MGEASKIEWKLERWLNRRPKLKTVGVHKPVTCVAKRNAVSDIKPQIGIRRKMADMMGVKIPTVIVSAVAAYKPVAQLHVIAPALQFWAGPQAASFFPLAINISGGALAARCTRSRRGADLAARLYRMCFAGAIARSRLRGRAHFSAALVRHALSLHRRDKSGAPFQPGLFDNFAAGHGHGR